MPLLGDVMLLISYLMTENANNQPIRPLTSRKEIWIPKQPKKNKNCCFQDVVLKVEIAEMLRDRSPPFILNLLADCLLNFWSASKAFGHTNACSRSQQQPGKAEAASPRMSKARPSILALTCVSGTIRAGDALLLKGALKGLHRESYKFGKYQIWDLMGSVGPFLP